MPLDLHIQDLASLIHGNAFAQYLLCVLRRGYFSQSIKACQLLYCRLISLLAASDGSDGDARCRGCAAAWFGLPL